jgi:3'(2'), 5'-bisphosphate nucleotidase
VSHDDHVAAAELAEAAGRILAKLRDRGEFEGAELGHRADAIANGFLLEQLQLRFPGEAVLSEEALDDRTRLRNQRVWIIDPLDGTREYSEGRDDWAVHVALAIAGSISAAAVALPGRALVLSTAAPPSAPAPGPVRRIVVSRTRPPQFAPQLADRLGAELVPMGSAGAKTAAVILDEADAYVHAGGQHEWDSAAPVGVAMAAGLHASRVDGSPLIYNQPDPFVPDLLVCSRQSAALLVASIASIG